MEKRPDVTIELHPGETLHVHVPAQPEKHMHPERWELLAKCERPFYSDNHGAHAYTSVISREECDEWVIDLFNQAVLNAETTTEPDHLSGILTDAALEREAARRVAAALAVIAFGKEFLLR